jgi:lipoprotein-anchoring transpeptidase ErfK/SrfK
VSNPVIRNILRHSTGEPDTIGTILTSGCTGLLTQDMIDLHDRRAVKTKVIVMKA